MIETRVDRRQFGSDRAGQLHKLGYPPPRRPGQPPPQRFPPGLAADGENMPKSILEQVGTVETRVGLGDPRQLLLLVIGEAVRVLPQRPPRALHPLRGTGRDRAAPPILLAAARSAAQN